MENEIEKLSKEYQDTQEKLQALEYQKIQFNAQMQEYENAEAELDNATQKIYTVIGGVMIETTKEKAKADIKEKKESIEMRLNIISTQQSKATSREQELREQLTKLLSTPQGSKQ
ncbi:MAG: prefoldin subunit [Candidatus Marsarchaeota archaeon]|jgi:prefoldin beta subunit|nr:prefoldin subunit [Candidatus Marsarchaeota archaeon]